MESVVCTFTGDYTGAGIRGVVFRCRASGVPSRCSLYFYSRVSNREWSHPFTSVVASNLNEWVTVSVPFETGAGWYLWSLGATPVMFADDLRSVDSIGVRVLRSGTGVQVVEVGSLMLTRGGGVESGGVPFYDFMVGNRLKDSGADDDHDGLSNWGEYLAGTDPTNSSSGFVLEIRRGQGVQGAFLEWPHIPGRRFVVWGCTGLSEGFRRLTPEGSEIESVEGGNRFVTGSGAAGFYRVEILGE